MYAQLHHQKAGCIGAKLAAQVELVHFSRGYLCRSFLAAHTHGCEAEVWGVVAIRPQPAHLIHHLPCTLATPTEEDPVQVNENFSVWI